LANGIPDLARRAPAAVKVMPETRLRVIRHLLPLGAMSYWVYILTNKKNGVLHTGVTNDLARRIEEHRSGSGSLFAAKYKLALLVYAQEFGDPVSAIQAEKALKKWRRDWKVALIERDNPEWRDLSPDRG
jgi:putative endonuclease